MKAKGRKTIVVFDRKDYKIMEFEFGHPAFLHFPLLSLYKKSLLQQAYEKARKDSVHTHAKVRLASTSKLICQ